MRGPEAVASKVILENSKESTIVGINTPQTYQEIAATTVSKIEQYYRSQDRWRYHKDYLDAYTLTFLDRARAGFLANPQVVRNLSIVDSESVMVEEQLSREDRESEPSNDDLEAFARLYIAFGFLPHLSYDFGVPLVPSLTQMFEPPFTRAEVLGRIYETELTIGRMMQQKEQIKGTLLDMPWVLRTWGTFKAIEAMPLRNPLVDINDFRAETANNLNVA